MNAVMKFDEDKIYRYQDTNLVAKVSTKNIKSYNEKGIYNLLTIHP